MAATANRSSSKKSRQGTKSPNRRSSSRAGKVALTVDVPSALAEMLALGDLGWVVSCYQKLEPADRADTKYRIKLKNRISRAADRLRVLGFSHDDREMIIEALDRVEHFFSHSGNLDGARGVAVFAGKDWMRAVRLPYVLRSRVLVDRTPVVSELAALTEAGNRVLVAVADRTAARIFEVDLEGAREIEGVVADHSPTTKFHGGDDAPGMGEYRWHTRIREEKHRHFAHVADEVSRALRRQSYDGVVVGGIGVDADAVLPHLSTEVRDKVIGVLRLAPKQVTLAEIRERAMALWADAADAAAADAVGELEGLRAHGWATDGVEPTLKALAAGQVRTLIVDHDAERPGFRMSASGRLTTSSSALKSEGEPISIPDLLDDAIEDALRQRARVVVVRGERSAGIDQLAAILRFRMNGK